MDNLLSEGRLGEAVGRLKDKVLFALNPGELEAML